MGLGEHGAGRLGYAGEAQFLGPVRTPAGTGGEYRSEACRTWGRSGPAARGDRGRRDRASGRTRRTATRFPSPGRRPSSGPGKRRERPQGQHPVRPRRSPGGEEEAHGEGARSKEPSSRARWATVPPPAGKRRSGAPSRNWARAAAASPTRRATGSKRPRRLSAPRVSRIVRVRSGTGSAAATRTIRARAAASASNRRQTAQAARWRSSASARGPGSSPSRRAERAGRRCSQSMPGWSSGWAQKFPTELGTRFDRLTRAARAELRFRSRGTPCRLVSSRVVSCR